MTTQNSADFQPKLQNIPDNISTDLLVYGQSKPNIISLAQGDSHLKTPDYICNASHQAMMDGITHYGPVLGQPILRGALSDYYADIFDCAVPSQRIFVTSSGTTAIHLALHSILSEGDEVICITPIWRNIMGIVGLTGAKGVQVPLEFDEGEGWSLDLEKVYEAVTDKTKAILIVTPSNPTGWIMPEADMENLFNFTRERKLWLVADEVYNRLSYGEVKTKSFLEMAHDDDLLYSVNSFSKSWAMTGWRLGWLVGPTKSAPAIQNLALYETMGAPSFNQYGAAQALKQGEEFIAHQKSLWRENLDILEERFSKNQHIIFKRSQSTFYAFFKVRGEDDCALLCRKLIDEAGVSVAPGCSFGKSFEGWIRLCFAVSQEQLIEAIDRIETLITP